MALGTVYFLRARDGGPVKIGFTAAVDPDDRRSVAQTYNPAELTVVAETPGSMYDEERLHAVFDRARGIGEWFLPVPELMELIHALHDGIPLSEYLDAHG